MASHRGPLSAASAIRVWMEVNLDSNPIRGTLRSPGRSPSAFVGWLGLTVALDGLRAGADPPPPHATAEQETPP